MQLAPDAISHGPREPLTRVHREVHNCTARAVCDVSGAAIGVLEGTPQFLEMLSALTTGTRIDPPHLASKVMNDATTMHEIHPSTVFHSSRRS